MNGFERVRGVVAAAVALLLLASTAVPLHAGEHCAGMAPSAPEHHGTPHRPSPNNTQAPGPDCCLHCPPAPCASELAGSTALVAAGEEGAAAVPSWATPALRHSGTPPPTPPPQARLPIV